MLRIDALTEEIEKKVIGELISLTAWPQPPRKATDTKRN